MPSSACQTCALRSEEHTSELQSHDNLVCRLLLLKNELFRSDHNRPRPNSSHTITSHPHYCVHTTPDAVHIAATFPLTTAMLSYLFFFFNDAAPTEIYTLPLHDALPINDTATTEIYPLSLHDALPISVVAVS